MFFMMFIFIMILLLMTMLNFFLSKKMIKNREKSSPFECGFDCKSSNRLPFSLQFYLIMLIFLIFDVEISVILPMILISYESYVVLVNFLLVLFILLLGIYMEWKEGALKWIK